jgi:hypothetical protein
MPLGENLLKKGLITQEQLDAALTAQKAEPGKRLGAILVERGVVTDKQVEESL